LFTLGVKALAERRRLEARVLFASGVRRDPGHLKSQLGLALLDGNRKRAEQISRQLRDQGVRDADLERLRRLAGQRIEGDRPRRRRP
jgi:hypothetical protein